jgi:hypothetical protein
MTCPKTDLFTWGVQCTPAPAFLWTTYQLPALVAKIVSVVCLDPLYFTLVYSFHSPMLAYMVSVWT